jgi:putative Holliday junction resolvase
MKIGLIEQIYKSCPDGYSLLGLDVGKKTIGLAVSNPDQTIATPLDTIKRTKFLRDVAILESFVKEFDIRGFVIGFPVSMSGDYGPACDMVRSFAEELRQQKHIVGQNPWIALWDERLSTASVENLVGGHVDLKKAKQEGIIDKLAAQHILQGALDYMITAKSNNK